MILATAVDISERMEDVSTPSKLMFVERLRHGISYYLTPIKSLARFTLLRNPRSRLFFDELTPRNSKPYN